MMWHLENLWHVVSALCRQLLLWERCALCLGGDAQRSGLHSTLHFDAPLFPLHRPVAFLMSSRSTKKLGSGGTPGILMVVAGGCS